jgi:hypothetical protein
MFNLKTLLVLLSLSLGSSALLAESTPGRFSPRRPHASTAFGSAHASASKSSALKHAKKHRKKKKHSKTARTGK